MDKFADAVALLASFPADLREDYKFEEAYCLYRLNKHEESSEIIDAVGEDDPAAAKMDQLRAQVVRSFLGAGP